MSPPPRVLDACVGASGLGFGVCGLGSGVWGLGSGVWGLGSGVWGLGSGVGDCGVWGCRVLGLWALGLEDFEAVGAGG